MDLDPNRDGQITEEEFTKVIKYISIRSNSALPAISGKKKKFTPDESAHDSATTQSKQQADITMQIYEQDKKKYGALLPKTGVYFLPDEKVLGFLK